MLVLTGTGEKKALPYLFTLGKYTKRGRRLQIFVGIMGAAPDFKLPLTLRAWLSVSLVQRQEHPLHSPPLVIPEGGIYTAAEHMITYRPFARVTKYDSSPPFVIPEGNLYSRCTTDDVHTFCEGDNMRLQPTISHSQRESMQTAIPGYSSS